MPTKAERLAAREAEASAKPCDSNEAFLQLHRAIDAVPDPELRARLVKAVEVYEEHRAEDGRRLVQLLDHKDALHRELMADANKRAADGDAVKQRLKERVARVQARLLGESDDEPDHKALATDAVNGALAKVFAGA